MFKIVQETKKALKLEYENVTFWVQRRWLRGDDTLTPRGTAAFEKAKNGDKPKVKPFLKCKPAEMRQISDKAVVVTCFDGSSAVLPTSQIKQTYDDAILVPLWLAEKKSLQFSNKKIWLEETP